MNKRERMQCILEGKTPDRPATCFWHHFGPLSPEETVAQHVKFFRDTDVDIVKMMCDEFFTYPMRGAETPEEMMQLTAVGRDDYYVQGQAERAAQVREAINNEAIIIYNAFSPYATLKHTIGDFETTQLLREHTEVALHLLDIICEDTCCIIDEVLGKGGATGMLLSVMGAEEGKFTKEEYLAWIRPTEEKVIAHAESLSGANMLHMCGWDGIKNQLDWWKDYSPRMVSWAAHIEGVNPQQARELFKGKVLVGGFDNRAGAVINTGSEEEVKAYARRIVKWAGKEELVLGADCSLPDDIDHKRVRWIVEALEEMA